ncbi:SKA1 protein, partial [Menura novaehollandiae]|nr:SKA1 protein [Menura novaehollandiae]
VVPTVKHEKQTKVVEQKCAKKPATETKLIKQAALITTEEFESVPTYLKGRLRYDQINAVVQEINKAVMGKYKILNQPLKSMSVPVRNLYHRFMEEETKDTKGGFFIVEADIKEFTELKLDKRFHTILSILRHCRRVREVRGSGLVRYIIP